MSFKHKTAIIGAGPAGCICAYYASLNTDVTLFDFSTPLHTLLCTGGGRCNLAYGEYDFKELAKNYPRGEKFLYSVFSKFSTKDTLDFFKYFGVETYMQDDLRFFPKSNIAKDVRDKMLDAIKNCNIIHEKVINIEKNEEKFRVETNVEEYIFDNVVISTGGHSGYVLASRLGHNIIEPKPALTGLITKEDFKSLQGVSLQNLNAEINYGNKKFLPQSGDLLFTSNGISGPLAFKISSICAREDYNSNNPIILTIKLTSKSVNLQKLLNLNGKKDIKNIISELLPKSVAEYILKINNIPPELKGCEINKEIKQVILKSITEFQITITGHAKDGEIVTAGGVDLKEVNSNNLQSKLITNLYFCGEVLNIDGFCGGFNLQNCWATGFISGNSLN